MWSLQGTVTQPFNRDMAHNGKIWEFRRERKSERPRQLPHRQSQFRTNPKGREETRGVGGEISLLRELYCTCSGSKEAHCGAKGLRHLLGLSRMSSFSSVWVQHISGLLRPGQCSLWHRSARALGLGSVVAACRAPAQSYLVKTTALIISCFVSLLGFFPSA